MKEGKGREVTNKRKMDFEERGFGKEKGKKL